MARKLDADRIEKSRAKRAEDEQQGSARQQLQQNLELHRSENSRLTVIEPIPPSERDEPAKKLKVCAYVRVSTQEEAQQGSFEMQKTHFTDLITSNPQYELVKIYEDEGVSGTQVAKRKGFLEMLEDAQAGKIQLIYTKSITRFGRNAADILNSLQILDSLNPPVPVIFETDHIDTADGKNKILISIMSALSELESQLKSEAIKAGIAWRMANGVYKYTVRNTLGYYRDYAGRVQIEENEAEIVKYIYNEFLDCASPREIADALTKSGITSPKRLSSWRESTIRSILSNEKYCGDVLYQKTYTTSYITHKSAKNNGVLRQYRWENDHPAIIEKKRWLEAQELLKTRKGRSGAHTIKSIAQRIIFSRIKSGRLAGYYLIDPEWDKEAREKFLALMDEIQENSLIEGQYHEKE